MSAQPGMKKKRFLSPQEKYEIWMQLVRGETTVSEAADRARVDRSTTTAEPPTTTPTTHHDLVHYPAKLRERARHTSHGTVEVTCF